MTVHGYLPQICCSINPNAFGTSSSNWEISSFSSGLQMAFAEALDKGMKEVMLG